MSLATSRLKKQMDKDPMALVSLIIENNPEGVKAALQSEWSEVVPLHDPQGILDGISNQISLYPEKAEEIIMSVLSVPIIEDNLDDVEKDWALNELISAENRFPGQYRTGPGEDDTPDDMYTPPAGAAGGDTGFNWGTLVGDVLPGILAGFGLGTTKPNTNTPPPPPKKDNSWIWLIVIVLIVIIGIYALTRAPK